jgi:RecJ-like exonuclease
MGHKMKLDGLEIEVADANAQSIIERAVAVAEKKGHDAASAERARADGLESQVKTLTGEKTALQAKADTLDAAAKKMEECDACDGTGKVDGKQCDDCGGEGKVKMDSLADKTWRKASRERAITRAVAGRADTRAKLLVQAAEHLSANEKLDGKSDVEIKKLVLAKVCKDLKLDGKDDVYVNHRFDFELEQLGRSKRQPAARGRELVIAPDIAPRGDSAPHEENLDGEMDGLSLMRKRNAAAFVKRGK